MDSVLLDSYLLSHNVLFNGNPLQHRPGNPASGRPAGAKHFPGLCLSLEALYARARACACVCVCVCACVCVCVSVRCRSRILLSTGGTLFGIHNGTAHFPPPPPPPPPPRWSHCPRSSEARRRGMCCFHMSLIVFPGSPLSYKWQSPQAVW